MMITDITPEIYTDEIKLDELLNSKSPLPSIIYETIHKECGHLMLADEILHAENKTLQAKKAALNLLRMDHLDRLTISFNHLPNGALLEKMLIEAKKSSSRYAFELMASLHNIIDELFLDPYLPQNSQAMTSFLRNFQRFARHHLETKIHSHFPKG